MILGALETGGTKMVAAIGNEKGEILERVSIPTTVPEETLPKCIDFFRGKGIEALGIAAFGPVDLHKDSPTYGYITTTPKLAWANCNLMGAFKEVFDVPMEIDSDVNGSCLGEATWGCTQGMDNSVYITVGTGLGVGIMVDGKLLHGMLHPEAGHVIVKRHPDDVDYKCHCPYHESCLEGLAAGPSIQERWGKPAIELSDNMKVWEIESYYLAQGIVDYILTVSPRRIVLGGGVMHQEHMMPLVRRKVKELLNGYVKTKELENLEEYLVLPSLNDDQGIMGCLKLALMAIDNNK
ncbi:ROK family protein [Anaerolentibacter hominis]|uniref:ROK family protein n=1 Tax=Anaerolentibacter hominis TaxID=3079009 RepID=UPI0031B7EF2B